MRVAQILRLSAQAASGRDGARHQQPALVGEAELPGLSRARHRADSGGRNCERQRRLPSMRPVLGAQIRRRRRRGRARAASQRAARLTHAGNVAASASSAAAKHALRTPPKRAYQRVRQRVDVAAGHGVKEQQLEQARAAAGPPRPPASARRRSRSRWPRVRRAIRR